MEVLDIGWNWHVKCEERVPRECGNFSSDNGAGVVMFRVEVQTVVELSSLFFFSGIEIEGEVVVSIDCELCVFVVVERLKGTRC